MERNAGVPIEPLIFENPIIETLFARFLTDLKQTVRSSEIAPEYFIDELGRAKTTFGLHHYRRRLAIAACP